MVIDTTHINRLFRQASNISGSPFKKKVFCTTKNLTARFLSNKKPKKLN